jgi:hypothetical protein
VKAATQRPYAAAAFAATPSAPPAWNTLPCWYLLGTEDKAIPPELQRLTQDEQARLIRDWNADVYARAREERARKAAPLAAPTEEPPDQQGLLGSVGPDAKEKR